jgi:hypothetical protein
MLVEFTYSPCGIVEPKKDGTMPVFKSVAALDSSWVVRVIESRWPGFCNVFLSGEKEPVVVAGSLSEVVRRLNSPDSRPPRKLEVPEQVAV